MPSVHLHIPMLAPSLNGSKGLMRMHHRTYAKVREAWVWEVRRAVRETGCDTPLEASCRAVIVRRYARLPLDLDNLYASCKVPLDALRKAGVIRDDDPDCIYDLRCRQEKVPKVAHEGTEIRLSWD